MRLTPVPFIWLTVFAVAALPLTTKVANPLGNPLLQALHESAHVVVFFIVCTASYFALRTWRSQSKLIANLVTAGLISLPLGGIVELVQPLVGRSASWSDMLNNTLGVIAACTCILIYYCAGYRRAVAIAVTVACLLAALNPLWPWLIAHWVKVSHFPTLASFEHKASHLYINSIRGTKIRFIAPTAPSKVNTTVLEATFPANKKWPGFSISSPVPNWEGYSHLQAHTQSHELTPTNMSINFYTLVEGKRSLAITTFKVMPGEQTLQIKLPDTKKYNPKKVIQFDWHSATLNEPLTLQIDEIKLIKVHSATH